MRRSRSVLGSVAATALSLLFTVQVASPADAEPDQVTVALGTHEFGHLSKPDAIVAVAGPDDVGFDNPPEGSANGPWSFDVAGDGSVWLLDEFNARLLVWDPGHPDSSARTIPLPGDEIQAAADLALGPDGTIYLSYLPTSPPDDRHRLRVCALSPAGEIVWTAPTDIEALNSVLRVGPDGALYWSPGFGTDSWTPVTETDGSVLSLAQQRRGVRSSEPVAPDRALTGTLASDFEWSFSLLDEPDLAIRTWEVTSDQNIAGIYATPALVADDPIVALGVLEEGSEGIRFEYEVLRLAADGSLAARVVLDPGAVWGDVPITGLRVGPDGSLYQLRSDIATGVTIARYSLGAAPSTPTAPVTAATTASSSPSPSIVALGRTPAAQATRVVATGSGGGLALPITLVALAGIGLGVGAFAWRRRSARESHGGSSSPRPPSM